MLRLLVFATFALLASTQPAAAQRPLNVVTTIPDLGSIAEEIGGDQVTVFSVASGFQNPHFVDPKPSFIVKMARADMFVTVGLDLESGWVPPLLNAARNADILPGADGYVDASAGVPLLQMPSSVSREQGDIHAFGNPHYWLDPNRGRIIAENIFTGLVRLRPDSRDTFAENLAAFNSHLDRALAAWAPRLSQIRDIKIMAYHNQWPYLEQAFGVEIVDFLEPMPGIPPTPAQLAKVIIAMERDNVRLIIIAPYYKLDSADLVARKTEGRVVPLASSVGAFPEIKTYFDLFEYNLEAIVQALDPGTSP